MMQIYRRFTADFECEPLLKVHEQLKSWDLHVCQTSENVLHLGSQINPLVRVGGRLMGVRNCH